MVQQTVRNLPEFHSVWADSLISILNKLLLDEGQAKKIMVFNIRQAYILFRMDTPAQRVQLDGLLAKEIDLQSKNKSKFKGAFSYDHLLKRELDEMDLEKASVEELEIKMFTYMTLAGIKPVQNTQQRAAGFAKFSGIPEI
jgi:hypothetical protein